MFETEFAKVDSRIMALVKKKAGDKYDEVLKTALETHKLSLVTKERALAEALEKFNLV